MSALPDSVDVDLGAPELGGRIEGDTLTVTINRPEKKNAVTADGYDGIKRAAMIVADEPGLNFLVITGIGEFGLEIGSTLATKFRESVAEPCAFQDLSEQQLLLRRIRHRADGCHDA